jgi:hypothetical protein
MAIEWELKFWKLCGYQRKDQDPKLIAAYAASEEVLEQMQVFPSTFSRH